jgi:LAGLIDADG DNA endonuclease family protein
VKRLPSNIEELLTPLAIAHWIMGDGYYSNSVMICTDNFTKQEVIKLIDILENKFYIMANIRERKLENRSVW